MQTIKRWALLATTLLVSGCGTSRAIDTFGSDVSSAADLLQSWATTMGLADATRLLEHYSNSSETTIFLSTGDLRQGPAEIAAEYNAAFREVRFERVELEDLHVQEGRDLAWARCRFKAYTVRLIDQSRWLIDVRTSFVLARTDDSWQIVFEHSSPIAGVERVRRRNADY